MKLSQNLFCVGALALLTACSSTTSTVPSRGQDLRFLSYTFERAEAIEDVVSSIEGREQRDTYRYGFSFFEENYKTLSGEDKVWYAILYGAEHQLDGEYAARFDYLIAPERNDLRDVVKGLKQDDFATLGLLFSVDSEVVKKRLRRIGGIQG